MPARKNTYQRQTHHIVLAANHTAKRLFQFCGFVRYGDRGLWGHWLDFTISFVAAGVTDVTGLQTEVALSSQPSAFSLTSLHLSSRAKRGTLVSPALPPLQNAITDISCEGPI